MKKVYYYNIEHARNTESVKIFQDPFDVLAKFSTGIGKMNG